MPITSVDLATAGVIIFALLMLFHFVDAALTTIFKAMAKRACIITALSTTVAVHTHVIYAQELVLARLVTISTVMQRPATKINAL